MAGWSEKLADADSARGPVGWLSGAKVGTKEILKDRGGWRVDGRNGSNVAN